MQVVAKSYEATCLLWTPESSLIIGCQNGVVLVYASSIINVYNNAYGSSNSPATVQQLYDAKVL